mgnify:CR=1
MEDEAMDLGLAQAEERMRLQRVGLTDAREGLPPETDEHYYMIGYNGGLREAAGG